MALQQGRIGSNPDAIQYDDADYDTAMEVDDPIRVNAVPVDAKDVLRLEDIGLVIYPINSVFISVVSTNPFTLLGFGTWVAIATGQFLVGYKAADPDFAPVQNTGGAKTHTHDVDVLSTTSDGPSATVEVDNDLDISTVKVADESHAHDTDPASVTSDDNSDLPPFFVIYAWKRTA